MKNNSKHTIKKIMKNNSKHTIKKIWRSPRIKRTVTYFFIFIFIVTSLLGIHNLKIAKNEIEIAIHVPVNPDSSCEQEPSLSPTANKNPKPACFMTASSKEMIRGAQLYIREVNREDAIKGYRLKLKPYYSKGLSKTGIESAKKQAQKIGKSDAVGVVGGFYSTLTIPAGKEYQKAGIPAITSIALSDTITQDNEWFFRTVPNLSWRSSFIATYTHEILKHETASIITDNEDIGFSKAMATEFKQAFEDKQGQIKNIWDISNLLDKEKNNQINEAAIKKIIDTRPEFIFFALQSENVEILLKALRSEGYQNPVFLASDLWNPSDSANQKDQEGFRTFPSDNVYSVAQFMYEVAGLKALKFRSSYEKEYSQSKNKSETEHSINALSYDATKVMVEAIKTVYNQDSSIAAQKQKEEFRKKIRDALAEINSQEKAVEGLYGDIFFDENRNVMTPFSVGFFQSREFISAPKQLTIFQSKDLPQQLSKQEDKIEDKDKSKTPQTKTDDTLLSEQARPRELSSRQKTSTEQAKTQCKQSLELERIITIGDVEMRISHVVYTGIDINKILNINQKNSSYEVDFYLWFRYSKESCIEPEAIEWLNLSVSDPDKIDKVLGEPILPDNYDKSRGMLTQVYRIKSIFREPFEFNHYPFDTQDLAIRFKHKNLNRQKLIYVADTLGMRDETEKDIEVAWRKDRISDLITDWHFEKILFFSDVLVNNSKLGVVWEAAQENLLDYSRFNAVIQVKRNRGAFILKNLLPLLFFLLVGYTNFFIPLKDLKFAAVTSLLLAVVFFHLNLLNKLPERVGYIVTLDWVFYVVYLLMAFQIVLFVIGYRKNIRDNSRHLKRLMIIGRVIYPIVILITIFTIFLQYR